MGGKVINLKEKKEKNYLPILVIAVVSLFLLVSILMVVFKTQPEWLAKKPLEEEKQIPSTIVSKEMETAKEIVDFIEIMKNQNMALNISPDSKYAYPGVPNELNEYPVYKTCDGRVMPNNVNPFATYSWAMLAYASMYDATEDENYIELIQETEEKLYLIFEKIDTRRTVVMFHPLYLTYLLLKGKDILKNEPGFRDMILSDTQRYIDRNAVQYLNSTMYLFVQDTTMVSVAFADTANLLIEINEKQEKIDQYHDVASQINKRAIDLSENPNEEEAGMKCWLLWSDYNLQKSKDKDISKFESQLLSKKFTEDLLKDELLTANTFNPCMEVLLDIFSETKNKKLLEKFNEYNSYYSTESDCAESSNSVVTNMYHSDNIYISDNAYQIYLITRSKHIDGDSR